MNTLLWRAGLPLGAAALLGLGVGIASLGGDGAPSSLAQSGSTPAATPSETPSESPSPTATAAPTVTASSTVSTQSAAAREPRPSPTPSWPKCGRNDRTVSGTVVDTAGKPLAGIAITAEACPHPIAEGRTATTTAADGTFSFPCSTDQYIGAGPFQWETSQRTTDAPVGLGWLGGVPVGKVKCGSTHRVVLQPAATVEGRLVDENGAPVDRRYNQFVLGAKTPSGTYEEFGYMDSDSEGRMSFTGLGPGDYTIRGAYFHDGEAWYFTVAAGETAHVTMTARGPSPSPS